LNEEREQPPAGREDAEFVELGEPQRESEEGGARERRAEERPNLDERFDRTSTQRKPAGPPLAEPDEREDELGGGQEDEEPPVDPD
jgi:hypothetical protein